MSEIFVSLVMPKSLGIRTPADLDGQQLHVSLHLAYDDVVASLTGSVSCALT